MDRGEAIDGCSLGQFGSHMENIFSNDQCNDGLNFSEISSSSEILILNAQDVGGPLCIYTI